MSRKSRRDGGTPDTPSRGRRPGRARAAPARKIPDGESEEQATVEEFAREGMGISSKE